MSRSLAPDDDHGEGEEEISSERLTPDEMAEKINRYEKFVDSKLKPQLHAVLETRDKLYTKQSQYTQLKHNIQLIQSSKIERVKTQINLGCDFYVQAVASVERVANQTTLVVTAGSMRYVGLGFHVEFTLDEAINFCSVKEKHLEEQSQEYTKKAAVISSHIKMVYEGIAELMNLQREDEIRARRTDLL